MKKNDDKDKNKDKKEKIDVLNEDFINFIDSLSNIIKDNNLTDLELKFSKVWIKLSNKKSFVQKNNTHQYVNRIDSIDKEIRIERPVEKVSTKKVEEKLKPEEKDNLETDKNIILETSPITGTFYSSPSPESKAYVNIGDKVKEGDIICIIEAMKVMNNITARHSGEIISIEAKNEQIVKNGQTLFKIKV